jgi:hypothetical protein
MNPQSDTEIDVLVSKLSLHDKPVRNTSLLIPSVIFHIFDYIPAETIVLICSRVCHSWNKMAKSDSFWIHKFKTKHVSIAKAFNTNETFYIPYRLHTYHGAEVAINLIGTKSSEKYSQVAKIIEKSAHDNLLQYHGLISTPEEERLDDEIWSQQELSDLNSWGVQGVYIPRTEPRWDVSHFSQSHLPDSWMRIFGCIKVKDGGIQCAKLNEFEG